MKHCWNCSGSSLEKRDTLAPLIEPGMKVYEDLKADIFGSAGGYAGK